MKKAAEKELMVSASVSCMDLCHLADAIEEAEGSGISFFTMIWWMEGLMIVSYYRKHS